MSEREWLEFALRDAVARGLTALANDYRCRLSEMNVTEREEALRCSLIKLYKTPAPPLPFGYPWPVYEAPYIPKTVPYFERVKRLAKLLTAEEIKPMNDVFLHCNPKDSFAISDCAAFQHAQTYKGALPYELGRIQSPRGATLRFIMDVEDYVTQVVTNKTVYRIKPE
jgi:hypothetical protein